MRNKQSGSGIRLYVLITMITFTAFTGAAFAAELVDKMVFPAENGPVLFYHNNHVNEVKGDCTYCHKKSPGKMVGFNEEMAHKLCIPCHEPREGFPEGPTKCEGCHKR